MTSINQIRQQISKYYSQADFELVPSAPLLHDLFPSSFNMSAGLVQLEGLIREQSAAKKQIFTVQNCIRYFDINKSSCDKTHLSFFSMPGALSVNCCSREKLLELLLNFVTQELGVDQSALVATVYNGRNKQSKLKRDVKAEKKWRDLGLTRNQIIATDELWIQGGDNLSLGSGLKGKLCGYQTELFFDSGKQPCNDHCQPGCDCGKYIELSNNLVIDHFLDSEGKLHHLEVTALESVVGLERLAMAVNKMDSIWCLPDWKPFFLECKKNQINRKKDQRLLLDRLRVLLFLSIEKIPDPQGKHSGRNLILRQIIRDIFKVLFNYSLDEKYIKNTIKALLQSLLEIYCADFFDKQKPSLVSIEKTLFDYYPVIYSSITSGIRSLKTKQKREKLTSRQLLSKKIVDQYQQKFGLNKKLIKKYVN